MSGNIVPDEDFPDWADLDLPPGFERVAGGWEFLREGDRVYILCLSEEEFLVNRRIHPWAKGPFRVGDRPFFLIEEETGAGVTENSGARLLVRREKV